MHSTRRVSESTFLLHCVETKLPNCCVCAAPLTIYIHGGQHQGHLGSSPFVVVSGRKEQMILRTKKRGLSNGKH